MLTADTDMTPSEGTDELRYIIYCASDHDRHWVITQLIPGLMEYSEIDLWALAGMFIGGRHDQFAAFIAYYASRVSTETKYRGERVVGFKRPTPKHPNPDPRPIWQEWMRRAVEEEGA